MRKLLKVILPPFTGFAIYFIVIRFSSLYFTLRIDEMGLGNLTGFMAFYRFMLPLLFTVAVLTQLLVINPVWENVRQQPIPLKINVLADLGFTCFLFAFGISYAIWDTGDNSSHFARLLVFMTLVQLIYWTINLFVLKLLS